MLKLSKDLNKKRLHSARLVDNVSGYLLIAPNLIGFTVFTLFGIIFSFCMAFTDWNLLQGFENAHFVGFKNFIDMIVGMGFSCPSMVLFCSAI